MTKQTQNNQTNSNQTEGQKLTEIFSKRAKRAVSELRNDLKENGAMVRFALLRKQIREDKKITTIAFNIAKEYNIESIDKRIGYESDWLLENIEIARKTMKSSKRGFTSVTALQLAVKKALKKESNVGLDKEEQLEEKTQEENNQVKSMGTATVNKEQLTEQIIANRVSLELVENNLDTKEFARLLKENLDVLKSA